MAGHRETAPAPHDPLPGLFSLLVGHQWPGMAALAATRSASRNRAAAGAGLDLYADLLAAIRSGQLGGQQGVTADDLHASFDLGESHIREITARNRTKADAYHAASLCAHQLRRDLREIAAKGEADVRDVLRSSAPAEQKINAIVEIVADAQGLANSKAAQQSSNVLGALQRVLDAQTADLSARQFAQRSGLELTTAFSSRSPDEIRRHVTGLPGIGGEPDTGSPPDPAAAVAFAGPGPSSTDTSEPVSRKSAHLREIGSTSGEFVAVVPSGPTQPRASRADAPSDVPAQTPVTVRFDTVHAGAGRTFGSTRSANTVGAVGVAPPDPLPGYGVDFRPPASVAPVVGPAAATTAPAAVPGSAGGTGTAAPSAVVRTPAPGTSASASLPIVKDVVAGGNRLQDVLSAAARQEPRLRWAVGEPEQGAIVLVTDLAGGWIPPTVQIPAGVRLLSPAARRGGLATLLGDCMRTATYQPGGHLPPSVPTSMSAQARGTAAVEDLGWELSQATRWRDGLPRLAHTLARAVSAGTGVPDCEAGLLREHLHAVGQAVLEGYPTAVSPHQVGNWQLLATIDALVQHQRMLANYHLAWFLAPGRAGQP